MTATVRGQRRWTFAALLLGATLLLVLHVYARHSFRINPALELLHASVSDVGLELLADRTPIVVQEQLVRPLETARQLLRFTYSFASPVDAKRLRSARELRCDARHTVVVAGVDGETLTLFHPTNGADVGVLLKRDQAVIVPHAWRVTLQDGTGARALELDDVFTRVRRCFVVPGKQNIQSSVKK